MTIRKASALAAFVLAITCVGTASAEPSSDIARNCPKPQRHRVDVAGNTRAVGSPAPGTIEDRGTISGKPFKSGTIKLLATFDGASINGTFKIRTPHGSASGTVAMDFTISGNEITFNGTASFTGGKGKYKGIVGVDLKAYDHNTLDGQNGTLTLKGFATY
jgi:hypothetical protein